MRIVRVFPRPENPSRGLLVAGNLRLACALGRGGVTHAKREGDGATPAGRYRLLQLIVHPDRPSRRLVCSVRLPVRSLRRNDGWCERPDAGAYNRLLHLPHPAGTDRLWRDDHLYDVIGVVDWNVRPRASNRGSAIFLHLARPGYAPTAGCIALDRRDLALLMRWVGRRTVFVI